MLNVKYMRIAGNMKAVINEFINSEIEELEFVTVVDVELTKDLQDAKIYVQALEGKEEIILKVLAKNENKIKQEVARKVQMRKIPKLLFYYDHSLDNYNHIDSLLKDIKK